MTKPIENIIPRDLDKGLQQTLSEFSQAIDELVNFGSQIILWDLQTAGKHEDHLPATLFLRNFLEEIDAISILVKNSSIDPSKNLLRTTLENLFYIEYLLEADTYNRSMAFLITNAFKNRNLALKVDGKSQAYLDFNKIFKADKLIKNSPPAILKEADKFLENSEKLINSKRYSPFKIEYERTNKVLKKPPEWYSLFNGPRSIKDLATYLKYPALYEVLFRGWSPSSHGTDIIQGKLTSSGVGTAEIVQIRYSKDAQSVTNHCFNLCLLLFKTFIQKRIPSKFTEYQNWHSSIRHIAIQLVDKEILIVK